MNKIIISIICLLSIFGSTNAFFGSPTSLDLYKNIDKGIMNLEDKMLEFELEGGEEKEGILVEINEYAVIAEFPACLDESKKITIEYFEKITIENNISDLSKYMVYDCMAEQIIINEKNNIKNKYISIDAETRKSNQAKKDILRNTLEYKEFEKIRDKAYEKGGIEAYKEVNDNSPEFEKMVGIMNNEKKELQNSKVEKNSELSNINTSKSSKEWETLSIKIIEIYLKLFKQYQNDKKTLSEIKTGQIYKLSNIGLYSDGNLENSGFDLIIDIEDIDKIIFSDVIEYEGEELKGINEDLKKLLDPLNNSIDDLTSPNKENSTILINNIDPENIYYPIEPIVEENTDLVYNNYLCSEEINNNGLSEGSLNFLINSIENNLETNQPLLEKQADGELDSNGNIVNIENESSLDGNYNKVRDNSEWPCEKFFCINIDFITYQHNLFGGGENITIQYLLNRSNEHFKKYASTSLVQSKMSTNLFEIGLKDLNLPDVFHLGIQISTKPVPILNIEKETKKDDTKYSAKNMLESYYAANGLDYKRRNDLVLLKNVEQDKQNILNADEMTIRNAVIKQDEYFNNYLKNEKKDIILLQKSIDKKVSYGTMHRFQRQYDELDKFTVGINNYVENLHSIIKAMNKIPIDNG